MTTSRASRKQPARRVPSRRSAAPQHVLTVAAFGRERLERCLALAAQCKRRPDTGRQSLAGRSLALVFQKPSIRTRVSFEVAINTLGGSSIYLAPEDIQLDKREPIKDVARTLSRYVAGIVARVFRHDQVEAFARYASVPVINGLSDLHHPCQALADLLTIQERFPQLAGLRVSYIGDGNNVLHALMQGTSLLGMHLRVATPPAYRPDAGLWRDAESVAKRHGGSIEWTQQPQDAVRGADVIYTDVWTSMGQEQEREARLRAFQQFQVTPALVARAKPRCLVMHCLPAHRGEEIAESVLEGPRSVVFEQAENRLHAQKALLMIVFNKGRQG